MTWSGFRPSDDPCQYHYLVPSNLFASHILARMLEMLAICPLKQVALEEKIKELEQRNAALHAKVSDLLKRRIDRRLARKTKETMAQHL